MSGPAALPLLTHDGERHTRATETVTALDGRPAAVLSLSPDLLTAQSLRALARTAPLPAAERARRLRAAARHFLHDELGGLTFGRYRACVARVSGHNAPLTDQLTRAVADAVAEAPDRADRARPTGSLPSWRQVPAAGSGVWTRRGETVAAVLSGNTPTIHGGWLQALALGYRVAVRPSRREPFTAHRVVAALRAAGFRPADAVFLPTAHAGVPGLLRRADLALLYGGDDLVAAYAGSPTVKVAGPGRAKTLVTGGPASPATLGAVADSVTALSGTACVNTTAVLVEDDHARFARDLAALLRARAAGRQTTDRHLGPRVTAPAADALLAYLSRHAAHARAEIPLQEIATPHPDGGVVLGPAVFTVPTQDDPLLGTELPFPCVWIAPWSRAAGTAPLRDSLVVNAITDDPALVDALLDEPTVKNVHLDTPTVHGAGHLPHEDYAGTFLMRNKAVVTKGGTG